MVALAAEHELRTVDLPERGRPDAAVSHLAGDLRDPELARRAVEGADVLVHLAAHPQTWPPGAAGEEVLDLCARGTYVLLSAAAATGVERVVLGSTLDLLEAYPPGWRVLESWRPRPSTDMRELGPYIAELSARELARAGSTAPLGVICLRFGRLVDRQEVQDQAPDARWLAIEDAVQAIQRALVFQPGGPAAALGSRRPQGWWVFHICAGGRVRFPLVAATEAAFGYAPQHSFGAPRPTTGEPRPAVVDTSGALVPRAPMPPRPIRRLAVFGASGPLAAAASPLLTSAYTLRCTDLLSPAEGAARIAERFPDAPRPQALQAPHTFERVDVADRAQVRSAAFGMDALLNCTVVREDPVAAFRVNTIGAYNVMCAAVAHGIRRVIHTGPQILHFEHPAGYGADFDIPDEAPLRAGVNLYFHSKYLGLEICRIFAQNHGLEVPALLFSTFIGFASPDGVRPDQAQPASRSTSLGPAAISWNDAGLAVRRAIEVPSLPSPFEVLRILGDLPIGKFTNEKAKRVLSWAPRDSLLDLWTERDR